MAQGQKVVPLHKPRSGQSALAFHDGHVLMTVAETYPRLIDAILEMIQNAVDARAAHVRVVINLKRRMAIVEDNGNGAAQEKFERALTQICQTMKRPGDLGQFGRGLIAPLGKCEKFTFTSCPRDGAVQGFLTWSFVSADIQKMKEISGIPFEARPELSFAHARRDARAGTSFVPWRTQVCMKGIVKDRFLTRLTLDELVRSILDRYGSSMRKRGVVMDVEVTDPEGREQQKQITAQDFEGQPLDLVTYEHEDCGEVVFRLFVARRTAKGRRGRISFGESRSDFRVESKRTFWDSISGLAPEPVIKALVSGIFEGEITAQRVKVHPTRTKFVENDALLGLCCCLEMWYEEVGQHIMEDVTVESKATRYQELGLRSLKVIEQILKLPEWHDILDRFQRGTIGHGHAELPSRGEQPHTAQALSGSNPKQAAGKDSLPRERQTPEHERPQHHPSTVQGPRGEKRQIVTRSSTGLQFCYAEIGTDPFDFDSTTGTLTFNTSHRFWFDCEGRDSALMRYQEVVTIMALTLLRFEERETYASVKAALLAQLELMVFQILHGDVLSGRQAGKFRGQ